jgi:hypothetical protein
MTKLKTILNLLRKMKKVLRVVRKDKIIRNRIRKIKIKNISNNNYRIFSNSSRISWKMEKRRKSCQKKIFIN